MDKNNKCDIYECLWFLMLCLIVIILVDLRKWMDDFVVRKYNNMFKIFNKLIFFIL